MQPGIDSRSHILVVEDEAAALADVEAMLQRAGLHVHAARSAEEALALLETLSPDAIVLDLGLPGMSGGELLRALRERLRHAPVVVLTGHRDAEVAVDCMKAGAFDYLVKPADEVRLLTTVGNALRQHELAVAVASLEQAAPGGPLQDQLGNAPAVVALAREVEAAAEGDRPVLVTGEPGTEVDVVARAVHARSSRAAGPFLALRCGLVEADGQADALFNGGDGGLVGAASGGTLFLDDVDRLGERVQERLVAAMALAARARTGGVAAPDFRLVAGTSADLAGLVRRRAFRADLYMRLASAEVVVPPLRARGQALIRLARRELLAAHGPPGPELARDAEDALLAHPWPRNRAELREALARASEVAGRRAITAAHLALAPAAWRAPAPAPGAAAAPGPDSLRLADQERQAILAALERTGSRAAASRELGVSRSTLYRKLKEYGLE